MNFLGFLDFPDFLVLELPVLNHFKIIQKVLPPSKLPAGVMNFQTGRSFCQIITIQYFYENLRPMPNCSSKTRVDTGVGTGPHRVDVLGKTHTIKS